MVTTKELDLLEITETWLNSDTLQQKFCQLTSLFLEEIDRVEEVAFCQLLFLGWGRGYGFLLGFSYSRP